MEVTKMRCKDWAEISVIVQKWGIFSRWPFFRAMRLFQPWFFVQLASSQLQVDVANKGELDCEGWILHRCLQEFSRMWDYDPEFGGINIARIYFSYFSCSIIFYIYMYDYVCIFTIFLLNRCMIFFRAKTTDLDWAGNANVKTPEESKMRRVPRPSGDPRNWRNQPGAVWLEVPNKQYTI